MKYCVNCGAQLTDESRFCPCCGSRIATGMQAERTADNSNQTTVNYQQTASQQPSNVYAAACSSQQAKDISLGIINRAIDHFAPFNQVYKEYYKIASTSFVNACRIPVPFFIIAAAVGFVMIGMSCFFLSVQETRGYGAFLLILGIIVIAAPIVYTVIMQLRKKPLKAKMIQLDNTLMDAYNSFPEKNLFGPAYSLPALMEHAKRAIESGQANTVPEAIAYVRRNIIGIYKGATNSVLRHACTSRVYKKYTDRIKNENGNKALHFIID